MKKVIKITLWIIFFMLMLSFGFDMINMSSTIANILGFVLIIASVVLSIKTQCFTSIKLSNNK